MEGQDEPEETHSGVIREGDPHDVEMGQGGDDSDDGDQFGDNTEGGSEHGAPGNSGGGGGRRNQEGNGGSGTSTAVMPMPESDWRNVRSERDLERMGILNPFRIYRNPTTGGYYTELYNTRVEPILVSSKNHAISLNLGHISKIASSVVKPDTLFRGLMVMGSTIFDSNVLRNEYKEHMPIERICYIVAAGKSLITQNSTEDRRISYAMMEMVGAFLPQKVVLEKADGILSLKACLKKIMETEEIRNELTTLTEAPLALISEMNTNIPNRHDLTGRFPFQEIDYSTDEKLARCYNLLAYSISETYTHINNSLLISSIVAYAKRGEVTPRKISQIVRAVNTESGITATINRSAVKIFFTKMNEFITDDHVPVILNHWHSIIKSDSLRLRLLLEQAPGAGLTALIIIGQAIRNRPVSCGETVPRTISPVVGGSEDSGWEYVLWLQTKLGARKIYALQRSRMGC